MSLNLKDDVLKAVRGGYTPTATVMPKPNPNYAPPPFIKISCPYKTPCGWCSNWNKKCDRKIGKENEL